MEVDEFPAQDGPLDTEVGGPNPPSRALLHIFVLHTENETRDFHFLFFGQVIPSPYEVPWACRRVGVCVAMSRAAGEGCVWPCHCLLTCLAFISGWGTNSTSFPVFSQVIPSF